MQFCLTEKIPEAGFNIRLPDHAERILFDRRHLNQILWNICRNGWRHSRQLAGSLTLSVTSSSDGLEIAVCDDGPGVADDIIPHLFEPFITSESTGTGLGLYIARELCEANDARIQYKKTAGSSMFVIHLKRQSTQ